MGAKTYESHAVSVIIPTYNRRQTLERALRSVFEQSQAPGEVIVVDDGSTDGTAEWVKRDYPAVSLLVQANTGVSAARNAGIARAKGEWIALLDSDDAWLPKKLATQLETLRASPSARLCHTEEIWIRDGVRVNQMKKHAKSGGWLFQRSLALCCISPSSVLIHRSIFEEHGDFDESLPACEDYDLWLRITAQEPVIYVETPQIYKYGGHADQLSRAFWGMDRFRIQALESCLTRGQLKPEDEVAAVAMLVRKLKILVAGARKRQNSEVIETYGPKLEQWTARLEG